MCVPGMMMSWQSSFCKRHLPSGMQIVAYLPGQYNFPQDISITDQRPDIVIWSTSIIHLVELTVLFETNIPNIAEKKVQRYKVHKAKAVLAPTTLPSPHWRSAQEASSAWRGSSSSTDCSGPRPRTGNPLRLNWSGTL